MCLVYNHFSCTPVAENQGAHSAGQKEGILLPLSYEIKNFRIIFQTERFAL